MSTPPRPPGGRRPVFTDVDGDDTAHLVAMMAATDAWPAVGAARSWVLRRLVGGPAPVVVDVGAGLGTFGAAARDEGAVTVDVDLSNAMLQALRARHPRARPVLADLAHLPVRGGAADLVHVERVLQWVADPGAAVADLRGLTGPGGLVAVTDTDWGTFAVDHPDEAAAARLSDAALRWVPHPTLARTLPRLMAEAGATDVAVRTDAVEIVAWDPDHPDELDGPPGLPLRTIAEAAGDRRAESDVDVLADLARRGRCFATLTLVSVVARW